MKVKVHERTLKDTDFVAEGDIVLVDYIGIPYFVTAKVVQVLNMGCLRMIKVEMEGGGEKTVWEPSDPGFQIVA